MGKSVLLIGAGKHAMVIAEKLLDIPNVKIYGFVDKGNDPLPAFLAMKGYKILGDDSVLRRLDKNVYVHMCLGGDLIGVRKRIIGEIRGLKLKTLSVVHPSAYVAPSADVGKGSTILVNATVNTNAKIGDYCCVNTRAVIEHDCIIGENVFVQPGSVVAGNVTVGEHTVIGVGVTIREKIRVGKNCIIGGGAFVCKDIPDNSLAYGVPAKVIEKMQVAFDE